MTDLTMKLVVRSADEALDYYRRAFTAVAGPRHTDGATVLHAQMKLFGVRVSLKDADGTDPAPGASGKAGVIMEITAEDPDAVVRRAVDAGGTVVFPVEDREYGARAGRVRDPFGHEWIVSTPVSG
jgi:uncharacterized glyoxalase superfamily protein PhnB